MGKFKVVITDNEERDNADLEKQVLQRVDADVTKLQTRDEDDILKHTVDADLIMSGYAPITKKIVEGSKELRGIVEYFTGYDNIDVEAASKRGILVCHVPKHSTQEVPDHTLALILGLLRKIPWMHMSTKSGRWDWRYFRPINPLEDMTAGIIGFGRIGKMVAERLKAFNLRILAYDPYVEKSDAERAGAILTDLDTLLKSSDIVTVHTALTKETSYLIGKKELSMMKKTAIIVNASRGRVIDQKALVEALKTGNIAGAGLDVLEEEPPNPSDPILGLDNVIVTPHAAWYSEKASETDRRLAAEEAVRILSGEKPLNPINIEVLKNQSVT